MTDEEKKKRRCEQYRAYATSDAGRASQHARQKVYHSKPEVKQKCRERYYTPGVRLSPEFKQVVIDLSNETGVSINELFIAAFEEKYGVTIHKDNTTNS